MFFGNYGDAGKYSSQLGFGASLSSPLEAACPPQADSEGRGSKYSAGWRREGCSVMLEYLSTG